MEQTKALSPSNFELIYEQKKPDKNDEIVFYCMTGQRAELAAEQFEDAGYSQGMFKISPAFPCILYKL